MSGALTDTSIVAGASGAGAYTIDQSLRFNNPDDSHLSRTPTVEGNRKTLTFSCWVKGGDINAGDQRELLSAEGAGHGSSTDNNYIHFAAH